MIRRLSLEGKKSVEVIADQAKQGFRLFEQQKHFDGEWLLFTDQPYLEPLPPRDLAAEIDRIKSRLDKAGITAPPEHSPGGSRPGLLKRIFDTLRRE